MAAGKKGQEAQQDEPTGTTGDTSTGEELEDSKVAPSPVGIETEQEKTDPPEADSKGKGKTKTRRKPRTSKAKTDKAQTAAEGEELAHAGEAPFENAENAPEQTGDADGTRLSKVGRKAAGKDGTATKASGKAKGKTKSKGKSVAKTVVTEPAESTEPPSVHVEEDALASMETLGKVSETTKQGRNKPSSCGRDATDKTGKASSPMLDADAVAGKTDGTQGTEVVASTAVRNKDEKPQTETDETSPERNPHPSFDPSLPIPPLPKFRDEAVTDMTMPDKPAGCMTMPNAANVLDKVYLALSAFPIERQGKGYLRPIRVSDDTAGVHAPGYVALLDVDFKGNMATTQTGGMGGKGEMLTVISAVEFPWARGTLRLMLMSFDSTPHGHVSLIADGPFKGVDFKAMSDVIGRALDAVREDRDGYIVPEDRERFGAYGTHVVTDWDTGRRRRLTKDEAFEIAGTVIGRDDWGRGGRAIPTLANMIEGSTYADPKRGSRQRCPMAWAMVKPDMETETLHVFRVGRDGIQDSLSAPVRRRLAGHVLGINVPWMGRMSVLAVRTDGVGMLIDIDPELGGWRACSLADWTMGEFLMFVHKGPVRGRRRKL